MSIILLRRTLLSIYILSFGVITTFVGCDDGCEVGKACDATCEPGSAPVCVAASICNCVSLGTGGEVGGGGIGVGGETIGGMTEAPPVCEPLVQGDLVINEVMINALGTSEGAGEYIELVNVSAKELDLTGVMITYNTAEKLRFSQGCMAPQSAVAAFGGRTNATPWQWSTSPRGVVTETQASFSFSNSNPFTLSMFDQSGNEIDRFTGESNLSRNDGESVTRSPDLTGEAASHASASPFGELSSPARCSNGGSFEALCADGSPVIGGEMAGAEIGGSPAGMIAGGEQGGEPVGGQEIMVDCSGPFVGDLVLNEVMINPTGDDGVGEYIELINLSTAPVSLAGIEIWYQNSSGTLERELIFGAGCMEPLSAVAVYTGDTSVPWIWSSPNQYSQALSTGHTSFPLANSRDAILELRAGSSGQRLSQLEVPRSLIVEGVSANRVRDGEESNGVVRHDLVNGSTSTSSPGRCSNGLRYEENCGGVP